MAETKAPKKESKSELKKRLEAQAAAAGATLEKDDRGFYMTKPGERAILRVDDTTEDHVISRYLRGAGA